jgi:hypothetical protein
VGKSLDFSIIRAAARNEYFTVPYHVPKSELQSHGVDRRKFIALDAAGIGALVLRFPTKL